jgi:hypothetical protein
MQAIVIHTPKKDLALMVLGSFVFVAICIWILTGPSIGIVWLIIGTPTAYVGILFFGFTGFFSLSRLLLPKPAFVIDDVGFLDNSSAVSVGFIPWADISGVHVSSLQNQRFLAVSVDDAEKYLNRVNPLKRALMRVNQSMVGTVINISLSALPVSEEEFLSVIRKHLRTGAGVVE